jgi:RHS repeat-associated protein
MMAASQLHSVIKINYPGSGNNSKFQYDGLSQLVSIVEETSGSTSSNYNFVWSENIRCEARDGSGNVLNRFFNLGQTIASVSYFYATDHLGSVKELTNTSGNIVGEYQYDAFGVATQILGSMTSNIGYCGYYSHARSGLNLTVFRAYSSIFGRWLSRDPIQNLNFLLSPMRSVNLDTVATESLLRGLISQTQQKDPNPSLSHFLKTVAGQNASQNIQKFETINPYSSVSNKPLTNADPLGLSPVGDGLKIAAAIAAVIAACLLAHGQWQSAIGWFAAAAALAAAGNLVNGAGGNGNTGGGSSGAPINHGGTDQ